MRRSIQTLGYMIRIFLPFAILFQLAVPRAYTQNASVPRLIRYHGQINLPDMSAPRVMAVTFSVFREQRDGTALWNESQQVEIAKDGSFDVLLGSTSAEGIPLELFAGNEARWLGMRPESGDESPRILLVSVPYALRAGDAETLAGRPASEYMLQPPVASNAHHAEAGDASSSDIRSSATVGDGTPNYLAKFINAATVATSNIIETITGIGVDVPAPTQKLDVYGRIKLRARDSATSGLWLTDANGGQQLFVGQIGLDSLSPFGIWHGNAWRLALTSAGDLGVGVGITPGARLDVGGRAMIRASDQGSAGIWLTGSTGARSLFVGQLGPTSNDAFGIWHNNGWRLVVDNAGNVGVGGVPQFPLDVRGRMLLRGTSTLPSGSWYSGPSDTPQLFVGQTGSTAASPFGILHGGDWRFALLPSGNVGIGTTAPTEKLEVAGNLKLSAGGKIVFSDGSSISTIPTSIVPQDTSLQVQTTGNQVQLAIATSGVTNAKLADSSVTSAKIADGSITASKLSLGTIPASAIAGTAATLGSNIFAGSQSVQGSVAINGPLQVSGLSEFTSASMSVSDVDSLAFDVTQYAKTGNANAMRARTFAPMGSAVYALALPLDGNASGVFARSQAPQGSGVYGEGTDANGVNYGVLGISRSSSGTGVRGEALGNSLTGTNYGLYGKAAGDNYSAGVFADATNSATVGYTYGVYARTYGRFGIGVFGYAANMTSGAATYGVYGRVDSPTGIAGMFMNNSTTGNVIVANNSVKRIMRLDASGNLFLAGTSNTGGADYAESVSARGSHHDYEPGDVLVIDQSSDRQVTKSTEPYALNVAGVFSTKPGILGTRHEMGENPEDEIPVAMVGIVPCKVSAENGSIRRGDLLVTSSTPGYAMRATDRSQIAGAILGKAMQELATGSGVIEIMVTLQ